MNKKFKFTDEKTRWRIQCPAHGVQYLTREAYEAQLRAANQPWLCSCGRAAAIEVRDEFPEGYDW